MREKIPDNMRATEKKSKSLFARFTSPVAFFFTKIRVLLSGILTERLDPAEIKKIKEERR
jgi:hypothetical protein